MERRCMVGYSGDDVSEYVLTTAFDISSSSYAGYSERLYIGSQENTPFGLAFSVDGTKLFTIGNQGDAVDEFTLSTAFDTTATHAEIVKALWGLKKQSS